MKSESTFYFRKGLDSDERERDTEVSFEAMRASLLSLHAIDSEIRQEIERAYAEAANGNGEYLRELYERQQQQLERYVHDEARFFINILKVARDSLTSYFNRDDQQIDTDDVKVSDLIQGAQGHFSCLGELHTQLSALGEWYLSQPADLPEEKAELDHYIAVQNESTSYILTRVIALLESSQTATEDGASGGHDIHQAIAEAQILLEILAENIRIFVESNLVASTTVTGEEEEDSFDYYDTDDISDDELQDEYTVRKTRRSRNAQTTARGATEEEISDRQHKIDNRQKELSGDLMTAVTDDDTQADVWKKMLTHGFIRGLLRQDTDGLFVLSLSHQVLPWCTAPPEEFFRKNKHYHSLFPEALSEITNPRTGESFPPAVFLDESGYALRFFLQDRWDEYLKTPQYQTYYYTFVDEQVPFAA